MWRKEDLVLDICQSVLSKGKHKWPTHSTPYLLVIFSGQAYFQEQLYNSALLGCSECYTELVPLHLSHVT